MSNYYGMPGPGGSLGKCCICGKSFMVEILMGTSVVECHCGAFDQTLFAHRACADIHECGIKRELLPPESPILIAVLEAESALAATPEAGEVGK